MPDNSHTGRLILTPVDPLQAADPYRLQTRLKDIAFISESIGTSAETAFLIGDAFLSLITFLGCSPFIEVSPTEDGSAFCQVRLLGPHSDPKFLRGRNTQPPRCMACRGRLNDWLDKALSWEQQPQEYCIDCERCGSHQRPIDLQWKQNAGFGRVFIAIDNIFPGEAVPVPNLLQELEKFTGTDWRYFYIQD